MKIVIKISEDSYKATCNGCMLPPDVENVVNAIKNGTPLPRDATNGDIFKAMFSNLTIYENRDNKDYPYVDVIIGEHDSTCYPKNWWDEQYKRGDKDADSD